MSSKRQHIDQSSFVTLRIGRHPHCPNAAKEINVDGPKAKRMADLNLHGEDLRTALKCLKEIDAYDNNETVTNALWTSAIIHFIKCFSQQARFSLVAKQIYANNFETMKEFDFFKALRNEHFAHDVNGFSQSRVCATVNKRNVKPKIALVSVTNANRQTINQTTTDALRRLIAVASEWVAAQGEALGKLISAELESTDYDELINRETFGIAMPNDLHGYFAPKINGLLSLNLPTKPLKDATRKKLALAVSQIYSGDKT